MAEYKLSYFPVRAKAESVRLALSAAGVKFEDVRVSMEEWQALKGSTFTFEFSTPAQLSRLISLVVIYPCALKRPSGCILFPERTQNVQHTIANILKRTLHIETYYGIENVWHRKLFV